MKLEIQSEDEGQKKEWIIGLKQNEDAVQEKGLKIS